MPVFATDNLTIEMASLNLATKNTEDSAAYNQEMQPEYLQKDKLNYS